MFLFGAQNDSLFEMDLLKEMKNEKDFLVTNFEDTYLNLPLKDWGSKMHRIGIAKNLDD